MAEWLGESSAMRWVSGGPATASKAAACQHPWALLKAGGTLLHSASLLGQHVFGSLWSETLRFWLLADFSHGLINYS